MNCERKSLRGIFESTDTEARNSYFSALVIRQVSETRIEVSDDGFKSYIDFDSSAPARYRKVVEVDQTYLFYKLHKKTSEALLFSKGSFMKVDPKAATETTSIVTLKDLVGRRGKEIITSRLFVKVWEVKEINGPLKGGQHTRRLLVGDTEFTVLLTFWNDAIKCADKVKPGDVLRLHTFAMDEYEKKSSDQPLNITFRDRRPMTNMYVVPFDQVPPSLQELKSNVLEISIEGTVEEFQDSYEFQSCPGVGNPRCGKSVKQGSDSCEKCKVPIHTVTLVDDYILTVVVFGNDGEIYEFKAFQSSLEGFEQPGSSPEEKLNSLVGKTVKIKASKSTKDSEKSLIEKISLV